VSTIKEIARRAGVSIGTVDRVIHARGRVSDETRERIRRIIKETGYRPNIYAKHLRLGRTFTFGVVMPRPDQDGRYWALPKAGIVRAQRELAAQKVEVRFFYYDKYAADSVLRVRSEILRSGLRGLLIAPVLTRLFEEFLKGLPPELPVVLFDSIVPRADQVASIGQDAFRSGVVSAHLMRLLVPGPAPLAVLRVLPEDFHIDDRVRGFVSHFGQFEAGRRVEAFDIETNLSVGERTRFFARMTEADHWGGVFVTNATTHQIADYLKSRVHAPRVRVIGYDLVEENVRLLREGAIDFLISQRSERQGYAGIQTLFRHVVLGEAVERTQMMPIDIISRENLDHYRD
jgi:LacI family transcriptional regulator